MTSARSKQLGNGFTYTYDSHGTVTGTKMGTVSESGTLDTGAPYLESETGLSESGNYVIRETDRRGNPSTYYTSALTFAVIGGSVLSGMSAGTIGTQERSFNHAYMDIGKLEKNFNRADQIRAGLRMRCDLEVCPDVRKSCLQFGKWLRSEYCFPIRVPVYIKSARRIRTKEGEYVVGCFFEPSDYLTEPYIRVATGDYTELLQAKGRDNALASILLPIAHELTHYFQWINGIHLSPIGYERQATMYSRYILDEYSETRMHP